MGSISINKLVGRIVGAYDHNRSGAVELGGVKKPETLRRESVQERDRLVISTLSRERLFRAADANGDGRVTKDELAAHVRPFDADGDGKLETRSMPWNPKKEYERFESQWGEDLVGQQVIPTPQPIVPPIPLPPHLKP